MCCDITLSRHEGKLARSFAMRLIYPWERAAQSLADVLQVFFHCDGYESLYKHVPRDVLPREYGGELDSVEDLTGELSVSRRLWEMRWHVGTLCWEYGLKAQSKQSRDFCNILSTWEICPAPVYSVMSKFHWFSVCRRTANVWQPIACYLFTFVTTRNIWA
jgi:hypothetical protein